MKLAQIVEGLLDNGPLDGVPSGEDQNALAKSVAGDDGEANSKVKQQLQRQADTEKRINPTKNRDLKGTLQRLGSTKWDPKNPTFQKLAAKALGGMK